MKGAWKLALFAFSFIVLLPACESSNDAPPELTNVWTWVSGSNISYQAGVYGTKGTPAPLNVPGARLRAASWLDSNGYLWLFGGDGRDSDGLHGLLNDLWKFDPAANKWTWVSGSDIAYQPGVYGTLGLAAPSNIPGARYSAASWLDLQGKLWLFGGEGYVADGVFGELNDLWKYDPTTNEWTWVSGSNTLYQPGVYGTLGLAAPSNIPGARVGAASFLDPQGELWLFGGGGYDSVGYYASSLNDLWKFDPATLEWTWISGSDTMDQLGIYGTMGVPGASNLPGARQWALSWLDRQGKFWLFGGWGWGYDFASNCFWLNDLWTFDPATLEWTWVSGSDTVGQPGVYGAKGTAALSNTPGARYSAVSWLDPGGKFWLFGGSGIDSAGMNSSLNDLWRFDPSSRQWTWVAGDDTGNQPGVYGTKGTAAASNVPGGRNGAISWTDSQGDLWLFGGYGYYAAGQDGPLNDLWHYGR